MPCGEGFGRDKGLTKREALAMLFMYQNSGASLGMIRTLHREGVIKLDAEDAVARADALLAALEQ